MHVQLSSKARGRVFYLFHTLCSFGESLLLAVAKRTQSYDYVLSHVLVNTIYSLQNSFFLNDLFIAS